MPTVSVAPAFETFLYGVVNASPDSLNADSIAITPEAAVARANALIAQGCRGIDLGGQGSTDAATVVDWSVEWARLEAIVPALGALGVPVSIDTWRPEVARRALRDGATVLNAADGMQLDAMWPVAAELAQAVVLPFLNGPDPRQLRHIEAGADPVEVMLEWFDARLAVADRFGLRSKMILDPGTGFAPSAWPWEQRYVFQKHVYSNLDRLRRYGLPIYIALPWKETAQHDELLEIVITQRVDYGRCHYPSKVVITARRLGFT